MDVELLVVPGCPHEAPATQLLRAVLPDLGLSPDSFRTIVIRTDDEAQQHRFRGSPTFLIDGTDPFAEPGQPIGLGCRIYRSGSGRVGGGPSPADLHRALQAAMAASQTPSEPAQARHE